MPPDTVRLRLFCSEPLHILTANMLAQRLHFRSGDANIITKMHLRTGQGLIVCAFDRLMIIIKHCRLAML